MPRFVLTVLFLFFGLQLLADTHIIDSLKNAAEHARQDTDKIDLLIALSKKIPVSDSIHKLSYAKDALELARRANNSKRLMDGNENLGRIYFYNLQNYNKAIPYLNDLNDIARQKKDTIREVNALSDLIIAYGYLSKYSKAMECGNLALQLNPGQALEVSILSNIGGIYVKVGDYLRGMDCYTHSLKDAEQIILSKKSPAIYDTLVLAGLLFRVGEIYSKMEEFDKALENYNKAISINNNRSASLSIATLTGKGSTLEARGDYPGAVDLYKAALSIIHRDKHDESLTGIFTALAGLYLKKGEVNSAQKYADSALSVAKEYGEEAKQPDIYVTFAKICMHQKQYSTAAAYLNEAIKMAAGMRALETEDEAWNLLSATYEAMKKPADALAAYRHYISIRDSIYNVEKAKEITRMDIESIYTTRRISDSVISVKQTAVYMVKMQKQKIITVGLVAGMVMVLLLSFFIFRNYSLQKKANMQISLAKEKINEEKQVSEALLLNILPEEVAKELKAYGDVQPKMYEQVTVLFTDFVNFTLAASHITPQQLVTELHRCFKAFDGIIGKYNIEKIKTVGDAYIAVSGLPKPNANHAADIVNAAREIRDYILKRKKEFPENAFDIRIGINSGPVVAGIVGVKKFAYDIWGDTVNVAARMEQNSEPGNINISDNTYQLVKDQFVCHARGSLDVKNKGKMDMYFVD